MNPEKFIIFSDLHVDIMHDSISRVEAVIKAAKAENAGCIINLGDILYPPNDFLIENGVQPQKDRWFYCERDEEKYKLRELFNNCGIPVYHVIGNHDSDACPKSVFVDFMGMKHNYYSFDRGDYHFVALDTSYIRNGSNDIPYQLYGEDKQPGSAYPCVPDEQLEWMKKDILASDKPTIILSHHPISRNEGIKNNDQVRRILNEINAGKKRIILCINGHAHLDGLMMLDGIPCLDVNSITCDYMGWEYRYKNFDDYIETNYPYISSVAPYKEAVFASITLAQDKIDVKGYSSEYIGPTPYELGLPKNERFYECTATIVDREIYY